MNYVWFDGKLVSKGKAWVCAFDEGFLFGQGLFETIRCYDGNAFAQDRHFERLLRSCSVMGIKSPPERMLRKAVKAVIQKNHIRDATLRLNLYKGVNKEHLFIFVRQFSEPSQVKYNMGFSVMLCKEERIGVSPLNNVKSLNHYFYSRLLELAKRKGYDEAFFLNSERELVEGTRANIFLIKNNKVATPLISCGCLPGVTRGIVLELFKEQKISVSEKRILPKELFEQDEIFVTNALLGIMPVTRLDKKRVGPGIVGRLTKRIMSLYKKEVERECLLR